MCLCFILNQYVTDILKYFALYVPVECSYVLWVVIEYTNMILQRCEVLANKSSFLVFDNAGNHQDNCALGQLRVF